MVSILVCKWSDQEIDHRPGEKGSHHDHAHRSYRFGQPAGAADGRRRRGPVSVAADQCRAVGCGAAGARRQRAGGDRERRHRHRHPRLATGVDRGQAQFHGDRRHHLRRGHRQVPRQERGRGVAARARHCHQPRVRRGRAGVAARHRAEPHQDAGQRPRHCDGRLAAARPALGHPLVQLSDAAGRDRRPTRRLQVARGRRGGGRHRRHDQRPHPPPARPAALVDQRLRPGRLYRALGQGRPAGVGAGQLEESGRDLRRAARRRLPEAPDPSRRPRNTRI